MKRIIYFVLFAIIAVGSVEAQSVYRNVKGYVVDKNGSPLPGAEVNAAGGGESVITDADGSFNMNVHPLLKKLTASYSGLKSKTLKPDFNSDMIFTLNPQNQHPFFINVNIGFWGFVDNGPFVGFMGGQLGKWGYYAKWGFEVGYASTPMIGTVGVIKSIHKLSSFLFLGIGYGNIHGMEKYSGYYYNEYYDREEYYEYSHLETKSGMAVDLGYILRPSEHFNLSFGYTLTTDFTDSNHIIQVGAGYVF
ncbi:MAG: carboxypeptidase-like regulatory domain-containing protein [Paramuribaculum sp.]|nr:carboxypeptidase-like regulatory domain-containing protein [Paramuribaculum sp.]